MLRELNILVVGVGISGTSAAKTCKSLNGNVILYDDKSDLEMNDFTVVSRVEDINFDSIDIVIASPGIRINHPVVSISKKYKIPIWSEIELGYRISDNYIIGITGTNGKTTTTLLICELLNSAGIESIKAGNIGLPFASTTLGLSNEKVILEISAQQLLYTTTFNPQISIITNINEEHLDYFDDYEEYVRCKSKIIENHSYGDISIYNHDCKKCNELFSKSVDFNKYSFSLIEEIDNGAFIKDEWAYTSFNGMEKKIINITQYKKNGMIETLLIMLIISHIFSIEFLDYSKILDKYKKIEHRLELFLEKNLISYYNDSKATNIYSTIHALNSIDKNIILICGGKDDKNADYEPLIKAIKRKKVKKTIVIGEISKLLRKIGTDHGVDMIVAKSLESAVKEALKLSIRGDNILFSPGANSKDMFENHKHRGNCFKEIVSSIVN